MMRVRGIALRSSRRSRPRARNSFAIARHLDEFFSVQEMPVEWALLDYHVFSSPSTEPARAGTPRVRVLTVGAASITRKFFCTDERAKAFAMAESCSERANQ
jgi:hypothetical protein